ncbi:phage tail sheath family protein [Sporomusa paucivorans]|uniref:phage tail sheath family protein n=1 Tax=Sporomusa paucivorans TaxID=2376 RepID=UPI003570BA43
MALGGGTWIFQNKVLPGAYINFKSKDRPIVNFADRGYAAIPIEIDWGVEGAIFTVDQADFQTDSLKLFGYDYTHEKLKPLRDLFLNLKTGHFYRLNSSGAVKAANAIATAKYSGTRGNDIKIAIVESLDQEDSYEVVTYLDLSVVDRQTIASMSNIKDNDYVVFKKDFELAATAGTPLTGGTNGSVTGTDYQTFLDLAEQKYFNILICPSTEATIKSLFIAYTKRMRDDVGMKFQVVVYDVENADYEGVVSIKNSVTDAGASPASLVYWLGGAEASCAINASLTNTTYNGEYTIDVNLKQSDLAKYLQLGYVVFHGVGKRINGEYVETVRVLEDVNTFTSFTPEKNKDFSNNQVIRILDQIAIDIATLFNDSFLGKVGNDEIGRASLKSNIIYHHKELERIRAIQNFNGDDVVVEKGLEKGAVLVTDPVEPVGVMDRLYMQVIVA